MNVDEAYNALSKQDVTCEQGLAAWVTITEKDRVYAFSERACYAGMAHSFSLNHEIPKLILNVLRKGNIHKPWLSWLMNESPFAITYADSDVDKAIEFKATAHRADVPSNLLIASMQAERMMWEHEGVVKTFNYLVEHAPNVNKNFLFCLSIYFNVSHMGFSIPRILSHTWWANGLAHDHKSRYYNFVSNNPKNLNSHYSKDQNYHGIYLLWSSVDENISSKGTFEFWLNNTLDKLLQSKEVNTINPFASAKALVKTARVVSEKELGEVCQALYSMFIESEEKKHE